MTAVDLSLRTSCGKPLTLPPELIARGRQAAYDMRAIEAAAGVPMLTVAARYDAAIAAIEAMEARHG